jgi:hypothetical protein
MKSYGTLVTFVLPSPQENCMKEFFVGGFREQSVSEFFKLSLGDRVSERTTVKNFFHAVSLTLTQDITA